ncbi:transposase [Amycolatopsis pigmentata]|uniref:Transposase n=1 Tax=Amycolatopsis pigmentata TaxID=450801 RepID=A0ABW5FJ65_9PSEU
MARILDLYDYPPRDGRGICVDEFGPLNLQPRPARGWFRRGQPTRLRATYNRKAGVRQMLAGLDLASGQVFCRFRDRRRWPQFLDFCEQLRRGVPTGTLYLICDNYGPHGKAKVTDWCADHGIELVYTPSKKSQSRATYGAQPALPPQAPLRGRLQIRLPNYLPNVA